MDTLPAIATAKLPATYEQAKNALATCQHIDECKDWANKAEALASYARQSEDESLFKMATRIKARAIRRCGELLREIEPQQGGDRRSDQWDGDGPLVSRKQAAADAGLSERQQKQALRVARVPSDEFEEQVECDAPPTVTQLADQGTERKPLVDLEGIDPQMFKLATEVIGAVRRFSEFVSTIEPEKVLAGMKEFEKDDFYDNCLRGIHWLEDMRQVTQRDKGDPYVFNERFSP